MIWCSDTMLACIVKISRHLPFGITMISERSKQSSRNFCSAIFFNNHYFDTEYELTKIENSFFLVISKQGFVIYYLYY